ncbi:trimethylamine methyltransferase family protein, partial [Paracoccaceae bacterium]|nr:trimethylamine methyltransferase family protein [Paracoccaceae bacterium]
MSNSISRRAGGRTARRNARSAPLADHLRPVKAGMLGGSYSPLSPDGERKIHNAALDALEFIGLADAPQSGIDYMVNAGVILGDDGRLRFPRSLVEDALAAANKNVILHGRDHKHDLDLSGNRVHFGTAGAAVHIVDVLNNEYRDSKVQDLFNAACIVNELDNIHFLQRPMVCRDIVDNREMDYNTIYACCAGTTKHVGTSFTEPSFVPDAIEMLHTIAGSEAAWRERPFV